MSLSRQEIEKILLTMRGKHIAVIGDIMLDQYIWGRVDRISPEAPVPIVEVQREESRVGGAGNVAMGLSALDCKVSLWGAVGKDAAGGAVRQLLKSAGIEAHLYESCDGRPTSTKTRIIAARQQVVRVDRESRMAVELQEAENLFSQISNSNLNAIVISDYGKGLLRQELCGKLIEIANQNKIPILVDPKGQDYSKYRGATIVTPNQSEAALVGEEPVSDESVERVAKRIQTKFGIRNILITRSERGMYLLDVNGGGSIISSEAKEVFDVTGAGDTVVAFVAAGLAGQNIAALKEIIQLANLAAGIAVGHIGVYSVKPEDILRAS